VKALDSRCDSHNFLTSLTNMYSIRVDLEIATPDKSAAEAVADELTPVTINVHLQNAGLPLAEVSVRSCCSKVLDSDFSVS
jgi:hypothetical protein